MKKKLLNSLIERKECEITKEEMWDEINEKIKSIVDTYMFQMMVTTKGDRTLKCSDIIKYEIDDLINKYRKLYPNFFEES